MKKILKETERLLRIGFPPENEGNIALRKAQEVLKPEKLEKALEKYIAEYGKEPEDAGKFILYYFENRILRVRQSARMGSAEFLNSWLKRIFPDNRRMRVRAEGILEDSSEKLLLTVLQRKGGVSLQELKDIYGTQDDRIITRRIQSLIDNGEKIITETVNRRKFFRMENTSHPLDITLSMEDLIALFAALNLSYEYGKEHGENTPVALSGAFLENAAVKLWQAIEHDPAADNQYARERIEFLLKNGMESAEGKIDSKGFLSLLKRGSSLITRESMEEAYRKKAMMK